MSSAVLEAPQSVFTSGQAACRPGGGRVTLEERLQAAWHSAQLDGVAECPVCRAAMRAAGASVRCGGCGSVVA